MGSSTGGIPGNGARKWTYSYVDDVVEGHVLAMEKGKIGERYILGGEIASANRFFEVFEGVTGIPKPRRHVPFWVMKSFAAFCEAKAVLFGIYPKITRGVVDIYKHDWSFDCTKAQKELGYTCTPLEEGLRRTFDWLSRETRKNDRDSKPAGG